MSVKKDWLHSVSEKIITKCWLRCYIAIKFLHKIYLLFTSFYVRLNNMFLFFLCQNKVVGANNRSQPFYFFTKCCIYDVYILMFPLITQNEFHWNMFFFTKLNSCYYSINNTWLHATISNVSPIGEEMNMSPEFWRK